MRLHCLVKATKKSVGGDHAGNSNAFFNGLINNKIMNTHKNTIYNILGAIIPLAAILGTIPLYIKLIGENEFGLLTIFWLSVGYSSLLDLGSSKATTYYISKNISSKSKISEIFWTSALINTSIAISISALILILAKILESYGFIQNHDFIKYFIFFKNWISISILTTVITNLTVSTLQAKQNFLLLNTINSTGSVLFQIAPLIACHYFDRNIETIIKTGVIVKIFICLILIYGCIKDIERISRQSFKMEIASSVLSFGKWIAASNTISAIIVTIDRFIIAAISGTKNLTYYTIPFQIAEKSTILPAAISSALLPNITFKDDKGIKLLTEKAFITLIAASTPLFAFGLLFIEKILELWISKDFSINSTACAKVLLIGFFYNGLSYIKTTELQANGRPRNITRCHIIEIIPYLATLFLLLHYFNVIGAAIAFALRALADLLLLSSSNHTLLKTLGLILPSSAILLTTSLIYLSSPIYQFALSSITMIIHIRWSYKKLYC